MAVSWQALVADGAAECSLDKATALACHWSIGVLRSQGFHHFFIRNEVFCFCFLLGCFIVFISFCLANGLFLLLLCCFVILNWT